MDTPGGPSLRGRHVLVISHDFPPGQSPQSIRALAFVRRLALEAARVTVLTRSATGVSQDSLLPCNVRVVRASAGWMEDFLGRRVKAPKTRAGDAEPGDEPFASSPHRLNWKGHTVRFVRRTLDQVCFPDGRALWIPHARRLLESQCRSERPDVALVMHEPAASLIVGRHLGLLGIPWAADLADPVLAPYTPTQWRREARRLERQVVAEASAISVTNAATAGLLGVRHGVDARSIHLLPQGFDEVVAAPSRRDTRLRLVYTGRFYPFRDPAALLSAVTGTPGVLLQIAGPEMPASVQAAAAASPGAIQLLGELDHACARTLQSSADVLVSVGNAGTAQTPGKVQEYFGAARPILHVAHDPSDPAPALLARMKRGIGCAAEDAAIGAHLQDLMARKSAGTLDDGFDLRPSIVAEFHWDTISARLAAMLAKLLPVSPSGR